MSELDSGQVCQQGVGIARVPIQRKMIGPSGFANNHNTDSPPLSELMSGRVGINDVKRLLSTQSLFDQAYR